MIILWKADYEGSDIRADLEKLDQLQQKIQKKAGGKVDGPYFPQDASVLYVFHVEEYDWLNRAGRIFFAEAAKAQLPFVPKSYEVAVTPEEFFGR
ncbi:MAG TPA: hypothetical protein VEC08_02880 [Nitrososphaerales archaeon]|nr:hypothetical protein [Nitrososphaerales archaeon]